MHRLHRPGMLILIHAESAGACAEEVKGEQKMRDDIGISSEVITEQSYLVSRGVRTLALVGQCKADPITMLQVATKLETAAEVNIVAFVIDRGDGNADYGFAAAKWAVDLFQWVMAEKENAVPAEQRDRILGLLLGYSAEAIRLFEERQGGRLFQPPTLTPTLSPALTSR
jgi:hypothetical protein